MKILFCLLSLILTAPTASAGAGVFGLSCANVSCGVNYLPNTATPAAIAIAGYGMTNLIGYNMVVGLSLGVNNLASVPATVGTDGTLYASLDLSTLQPGYYSFAIFPANTTNSIVGTGTFTVLGATTTQPGGQAGPFKAGVLPPAFGH